MRARSIFFILLTVFACAGTQAQTIRFITDGVIEYEKTVGIVAILQNQLGSTPNSLSQQFLDQYKKNNPLTITLKSSLSFSKDKALLEPVDYSGPPNQYISYPLVAQNNIVYTDLATKTNIIHKEVIGEQYLIKDSIRAIKWKITDETRDILGYPCRRANAIIMDSIYVVAFYTDDIPVSGGPESFSGLPGMILQVQLPHEHLGWVATKITDMPQPTLKAPLKGKVTTNKELKTTLETTLKRYGVASQMYLKAILL